MKKLTGIKKNRTKGRAILNLLLLIFFTLLFSSGIAMFIFSRQTEGGIQVDELLDKIGGAHTFFAFVVSAMVILHVVGNFKMFKNGMKTLRK